MDPFDAELHAIALAASPDYKVLRKLTPRPFYEWPLPNDVRFGILLDVETTGTDHNADAVIELGMIRFAYTACQPATRLNRAAGRPCDLFVIRLGRRGGVRVQQGHLIAPSHQPWKVRPRARFKPPRRGATPAHHSKQRCDFTSLPAADTLCSTIGLGQSRRRRIKAAWRRVSVFSKIRRR